MKLYNILFLFLGIFTYSQTLSTQLDKRNLALGEPATYTLKIENTEGKEIFIAPKNEMLPFHFDIINDSIKKEKNNYERVIEFRVDEEGKFTIPAFDIKVGDQILKTISYEVEVKNTALPTDSIYDIMDNKEVKLSLIDYWEIYKWYVLTGLLIIAIGIALFYLIKYGKKQRSAPVKITHITLKKLDQLQKKKHIENLEYRSFYVELLDIMRDFLVRQYHIPADVLLTDDLITYMKEHNTISTENESIIAPILQRGDQVKFAKIYPEPTAMKDDFENLKKIVKNSIKDIEFSNLRTEV